MGLLDFLNTEGGQQGLGLLAAAGPRADGASFGQRLQEGLAAGPAWKMQQAKLLHDSLTNESTQMQVAQMKQAMADKVAQREILRELYAKNGMPQGPGPSAQPSPVLSGSIGSGTFGMGSVIPGDISSGQVPQVQRQSSVVPPKSDVYSRIVQKAQAFEAGGQPEAAAAAYAEAEKFRPKYSTTPQNMIVNGKLVPVQMSEDGTTKVMEGFGVKPEMVSENLGGTTQWVDKNQVQHGQSMQRTQDPNSIASNQVAWANNALAKKRFEFDRTQGDKPVWIPELGGFANPRTQQVLPARDMQGNKIEGSGPKMTEDQGKASGWLLQSENAFKNMKSVMDTNPDATRPGAPEFIAAIPSMGLGKAVGNSFRSTDKQKFQQGASSLSEALLHAATGAGFSKEESISKAQELTPIFGEDPEVTKQKMDAIPIYIEGLKLRAGPGATKKVNEILNNAGVMPASQGAAQPQTKTPTMRWNQSTGKLEMVGG